MVGFLDYEIVDKLATTAMIAGIVVMFGFTAVGIWLTVKFVRSVIRFLLSGDSR